MRKIRIRRTASDRLLAAFEHDLNDAQRQAATAPDGPNLILAGPGTGKTRVITYRVAHLIARGVPAESILLVTFTRRAAREMVGRLQPLIGAEAARVWAGTFHHIGNRILRPAAELLGFAPNFTILDGEDQRELVKLAMDDAQLLGKGKYTPKPAVVQHVLSFAFNTGKPLDTVLAEQAPELALAPDELKKVAGAYAARKRAANSLDYDDLLGQWQRLLDGFPDQRERQGKQFRHILVDEMQDTNRAQVAIVEAIARAGPGNLTAVGDDAQSIYRFRGAEYDNILKFPERNPGTRIFRLELNYRSTPQIVALTNASIACNRQGFPKTLISARDPGIKPLVVPTADVFEEAELVCSQVLEAHEQGVALGKMAVLFRNRYDSMILQDQLVQHRIPFAVRGGLKFYEQAHIKDVIAYLKVVTNPRDELAWRRLLLMLPGIGPAKAGAVYEALAGAAEPLAAIRTGKVMDRVPAKGKGHFAALVADIGRILAADPERHPADAIDAILHGGYPAHVRAAYEAAENRLADIEQLSVLASRYESLEELVAHLILAGDVYAVDSIDADEPVEQLVLSTIHQAKGLEWSRVFLLRLNEDSFPSVRSLREEAGEEEERRIFYVAVTRAMDELTLTYPQMLTRRGRNETVVAQPSRFVAELDELLYETATIDGDVELAWSSGQRAADVPNRPERP